MDRLKELLNSIREGKTGVEDGIARLRDLPFADVGHTKFDTHRLLRNGFPEVIYAESKTPEQVADIFINLKEKCSVLATRVSPDTAEYVLKILPDVEYNKLGRTLSYVKDEIEYKKGEVRIITAGTSDLPIAEEALVTCRMFGCRAEIISDVGVAGIHRLFDKLSEIRKAKVIIVIAGMEGALAGVVGGLVSQPVIAVPTSVGYGAAFGGVSALLGMLTSCAGGITVVNIDNGFGAACAAMRIINSGDSF
ncbi:nickel pincer cofactor biosynthesis protein LarB [Geovibrio sp. ADMFC3]